MLRTQTIVPLLWPEVKGGRVTGHDLFWPRSEKALCIAGVPSLLFLALPLATMSSVTLLHLLSHSQYVESQLPDTEAIPCSSQAHNPKRSARMEFVGSGGSSAVGSGFLVVPSPNYLEIDSDNDDEEVVIGIRPKSSPQPRRKTSISEDESDISEPPSLSGSRRVSFADTVGLSLVQVKEFDKWDFPQLPDYLDSTNNGEDEYFISPFNFPLSLPSEEIGAKVLDQKVELESIELLPGTTILKGVIRVLNISFTKAVYVRTSLDNWVSHFDLLCEYIPGSGDGQSDSFSFRLTLMPPFAELGARVDFCLRYETPNGTFWANNRNRNYVLFCYKRKKEVQEKPQKEHLNKKSCLKTVSQSSSMDESMSSPERENHAADVTLQQKITTESQSNTSDNSPEKSEEEANTQMENRRNRSRRNRRKAARMARVREHFAQTQNTETQEFLEKPPSAAQEHNLNSKQSNPKGSVQWEEGTANGSVSKDSNGMKHEHFNLAEVVTNDSRDETKDEPKVATALHQNPNNLNCTIEETGAQATSYCGHPSGQRGDSKRLVSDPSGFAFGTVVAPLYQEVSGKRKGSQLYDEMETTMKEQQEADERRSSDAELNVFTEHCWSDGKVVEATSSNDETRQVDNDTEKSSAIQDSLKVQINTIPDVIYPIYSLNCNLLNASEKILDCKSEIENSDLSLDRQVLFPNEDLHVQLENEISHSYIDMNKEDTELTTGAHDPSPFESEKQLSQISDTSDITDPSIENTNTNLSLLPPRNASSSLQLSQNEFLQNEIAETSDGVGVGREFVDKSLAIQVQDFSGKSKEILSFQPSQHEELLDHSANFMIRDPNLVPETCGTVSPSNLSKAPQVNLYLNPQLSQTVCLPDPSANPCNTKDEINLEIEDRSRAVSPKHISETPASQYLSFEQLLTKNMSDRPANMSNPINDLDNEASILVVSPSPVTPVSEKENPLVVSQLSQNVDSKSVIFEDQSVAISPAQTQSQVLLLEQNKGFVDQPNNTSDLTGEVSLEDEDSQTAPMYETTLSVNENTIDDSEAMAQGNPSEGNVLLEQNEDLENKSNSCVQDHSSNCSNLMDEVCPYDAECVMVTSARVSKSFEENPNLSLQPSQTDKPMYPGELELSENLFAISPNLGVSDGENKRLPMQLSQNEILTCQEENASLPIEDFKCDLISSVDQPTNASDLLAHLELMPDLTKTVTVFKKEDEKNPNINIELEGHEIIANSEFRFEDKVEITRNRVEIEQKETSKYNDEELSEVVGMDREWTVDGVVDNSGDNSKIGTDCGKDDKNTTFENVADLEMLSHIETIDTTLREETKTWEAMVEEEQKNVYLETTSEDTENIIRSLVEDDRLESQDNVEVLEIVSGGQYAIEEIQKREDALDEFATAQEPHVNNNTTYFEPVDDKLESLDSKLDNADLLENASAINVDVNATTDKDICKKGKAVDELENVITCKVEMQSLCSSSEENVGDCASVTVGKQLNDSVGRIIMDSMDNLPESENPNVDYIREAKVKIQLKSNEEERFKIPPRKVRSKLPAPVNNVQEGIQSSQVEIVEETSYMPTEIGKTDSLCCSKDTNDDSFAEDLKYDQEYDTETPSESESDSEDEMELYMHCLRAVYGQQSSSKATKLELNRDKEFKRLPSTRSKRSSTSLPSISEALDEEQSINLMEQPIGIQEKDTETVEVQPAVTVLPDSSPKKENYDDDLWQKLKVSCRNILKSLFYAILVVIFLAVSYHYDFLVCFGLYVISVIWLFFQGERQTGKRNS